MSPTTGTTGRATPPDALAISLTAPDPIPDEGIERATELMRTGRLFRYDEVAGPGSETALWEEEIAEYLGRRYAVAVSSCGSAIYLALHAAGLRRDEPVLVSSWTLAPVPGAVEHAGGRSVFVETTPDLTVDLEDLDRRAAENPGSILLLSHMRGHISDLDAVTAICERHDLRLVEDCAHSLGGSWAGRMTATWGVAGCLSTQTFKHLNSGEGGVLVTDDDELAARAILASGSYMLYEQHTRRPAAEVFEPLRGAEPNHSMRLSALAAAVLRPQLRALPDRIDRWNELFHRIATGLSGLPQVRLPERPPAEQFVGSSLQFFLPGFSADRMRRFCDAADRLGVHVKWFGAARPDAFTSAYSSWSFAHPRALPATDHVLATLCDIRVPLALTLEHCDQVVAILAHALRTATCIDPDPETASDGSTS